MKKQFNNTQEKDFKKIEQMINRAKEEVDSFVSKNVKIEPYLQKQKVC